MELLVHAYGTTLMLLRRLLAELRRRLRSQAAEPQRGDVPGWVLITMMTAGLVTALWVFAGDALVAIFDRAIHGVHGPSKQ